MNTLSNPLSPTRVRCMSDKHQVFEEPCESKDSRTVLKTSAGGDTCTEFNQRRLSRKKRRSKNYEKQRLKVARLHHQIDNTRKDFHYKQAHALCDGGDMVFMEDLDYSVLKECLENICLMLRSVSLEPSSSMCAGREESSSVK